MQEISLEELIDKVTYGVTHDIPVTFEGSDARQLLIELTAYRDKLDWEYEEFLYSGDGDDIWQ